MTNKLSKQELRDHIQNRITELKVRKEELTKQTNHYHEVGNNADEEMTFAMLHLTIARISELEMLQDLI